MRIAAHATPEAGPAHAGRWGCSSSTAWAPEFSAPIFPVVVACFLRNTGRLNVAQGAIITAQGIAAALSIAVAGLVVAGAGYSAASMCLGAVAAVGSVICYLALPETRHLSGVTFGPPNDKAAAALAGRPASAY